MPPDSLQLSAAVCSYLPSTSPQLADCFRHSALFARPGEVLETIQHGVPAEADTFRPEPYSAPLTYAVTGGWRHLELSQPLWMRHYQVFRLPRPVPLWMRRIAEHARPVNMSVAEAVVVAIAVAGLIALWLGRTETMEHAP